MRCRRLLIMTLVALASGRASAQTGQIDEHGAMAPRFVDRINGLTLDQAIARAVEGEPGLRAARSSV